MRIFSDVPDDKSFVPRARGREKRMRERLISLRKEDQGRQRGSGKSLTISEKSGGGFTVTRLKWGWEVVSSRTSLRVSKVITF